jgi:hypothetical protein
MWLANRCGISDEKPTHRSGSGVGASLVSQPHSHREPYAIRGRVYRTRMHVQYVVAVAAFIRCAVATVTLNTPVRHTLKQAIFPSPVS